MGKGRIPGTKLSEETKRKIGLANKGKKRLPISEETRAKMSIASTGRVSYWKGKKRSEETKSKIGKANKGKNTWRKGAIMPEAQKQIIREKMSGSNSPRYIDGRRKNKLFVSWSKNKRNRLKLKVSRELGSHTFEEWEELKDKYHHTCPCCKLSEPFDQRSKLLTEDHIIPLSKGGSDLIENIQPLCLRCNLKKNISNIKYEVY